MKILYVEDNRFDADLTRRELKKSAPDFLMDTVATQHDALLALEKKRDYDLVLSDMRLPDGDGLAILTHIRGRGLPQAVVIITGQGDEETAVAALKAGAQDYVVKRDGYCDHLPLILEKALERYRETSIRSSQPLRVLYAEPSAADADLTKRYLANFAPHVQLEVTNSASGVFQILSDHPADTYQAVLLDYRLSGMNALETLKELRQVYRTDLPIILITGQGDEEVAVQALKLGATDYVIKNQGYLYKIPSVLENAVHSVQLVRDHKTVTQLKHQNELLLNSAGEGIVGLDLAGNHTFVNPAAARMLGHEISEMVGLNGHSLWHHTRIDGTRYHEEACTIYAACREGTLIDNQEDLFWRKDGTGFPVEFSLMPISEGDRLLGSVLTFRDITERKRSEEECRISEERHQSILKTAMDGFWLVDLQGRLLEVNEAYCRMSGYSDQELLGMRISDLEAAETGDDTAAHIRKIMAQGEDRFETRHRHKDGSIFDVEISAQHRALEGGQIVAFLRDITAQLRTEENYRVLFREMLDGFALHDILCDEEGRATDYRFLAVNPAFERMTGLKAEEIVGRTVLEVLPGTERHWIETYGTVALTGEPAFFENYAAELKKHFEVAAFRLALNQFACIFADITERKRSEEALRESEKRYRELFEHAVEGIYQTTPEGRFISANPAMAHILGYESPEELMASVTDTNQLYMNPSDRAIILRRIAEDDFLVSHEVPYRRKDGVTVWLSINIRVLKDKAGNMVCLEGMASNVTHRIEMEHALRKSLREKESLLREIHHRVKNNMQIIASMLSLQSDQSMDEKIVSIMKQNESRIKSMALIHEKLYLSPDLSSVNFIEYLESIELHLTQAHRIEPDRITIVSHVADISFEIETAIPCGLIINELISNAMKHAFPEGRKGEIAVALQRNPDNSLTLSVSDNGIGLPEDIDMQSRETFGMELIGILTEQIDGTLEIVRGEGTTFRITFRELKYKKRT